MHPSRTTAPMYRLSAATGRNGRRHRGAGRGYRWCGPMRPGDLEQARDLSDLAYRVGRLGSTFPAVMNAANEVAVMAFLDGKIPLTRLSGLGAPVRMKAAMPSSGIL